jgi:hypothetical protein
MQSAYLQFTVFEQLTCSTQYSSSLLALCDQLTCSTQYSMFVCLFVSDVTPAPLGDAGQFAWNLYPPSQSRFLGQHCHDCYCSIHGTAMAHLESLATTHASSQDSTPQRHACVQCFGKRVCNACIWIIASRCDTTPARLANR